MGNFKDLKVWQMAKDLAIDVYRITEQGHFKTDFGIRDQMRRSSVSIPSNIAEGDELGTDRQSIRHFFIARGSTAELRTQLIISKEIGYLSVKVFSDMEQKCDNIGAMITKLIKYRDKQ